tara:strand:- start:187 stop:1875 length:1689 start_codon:yes stop_codon:yes gene_type:complete
MNLSHEFQGRNAAIAENFKLLAQVDELADPNLQSFVSNDPRTLWNMGTFLLQPNPLTHTVTRIDESPLDDEQSTAADIVSKLLARTWRRRNNANMRRGSASFFWDVIGNLTATGWFAIPRMAESGSLFVDFWEPSKTYPNFSDDIDIGLYELGRMQITRMKDAKRRAAKNGWDTRGILNPDHAIVAEYQLWERFPDGTVRHGVSFGAAEVKPMTVAPNLREIPVSIGAVGGIPSNAETFWQTVHTSDRQHGGIVRADRNSMRGQSIMATNEKVFAQLNVQQTFLQQLLHDIANPKTYEKSMGNKKIVNNADDWQKRGAHFYLGQQDELGAIAFPSIPPEGTQLLFSLRNMIQRGGFSDITFGNIVNEVTALVMAQSAESAQQVIFPFHQAGEFIFSEVDTVWLEGLLRNPAGFGNHVSQAEVEALKILRPIGQELEAQASYAIKVPGDLAARLSMAKSASPNFAISADTAMKMFVPEIVDARKERENVRQDKAEQHPAWISINTIHNLREASRELAQDNPRLSQLYDSVANVMQENVTQQQVPSPNQGGQQDAVLSTLMGDR